MSSFGSQTRKRMEELRKQGKNVPKIMAEVMEGATIAAVQKATEATPPLGGGISGTGTRSGDLAQHWATDSQTKPVGTGSTMQTSLANNLQYASYVNNGHKMDKHFVPGLVLNPHSGMLEKVSPSEGGIMVGTKTSYVKGKYMKEAGVGAFRRVIRFELAKRVREGLQ